jgi:hypothetical protein
MKHLFNETRPVARTFGIASRFKIYMKVGKKIKANFIARFDKIKGKAIP